LQFYRFRAGLLHRSIEYDGGDIEKNWPLFSPVLAL
jgi:hypothetical protein